MTTLHRSLLAFALLLAAAPRARAADDLLVTEAKQRMQEGKKLYGEGKYEAAWLKYTEACVVLKSDGCTRGLAFTAYKSGRYLAAYGYSKQLLEPSPKPSLTRPMIDELTKMKNDAYSKTGHFAIAAPAGAIVLLDEEMLGHAPIAEAADVDAGEHTIAATAGDGKMVTQRVTAAAGTITRVAFESPPAPPAVASVAVAPTTTTAAPIESPAPPPEPARDEPAPPASRGSALRPWLPIGLGVGAVALAAGGVVFASKSSSRAADADALRAGLPSNACAGATTPTCAALSDAVHGEDSAHTAAIVMYAGAGALAVGAIATWLFLPRAAPRAAIVPMVGPGTAGAGFASSF